MAESSLQAGSSVSHYRVVSQIGAGGMGEVYKAEDESLGRAVALKILPRELLQNPDRVRRFMQEAKAASSLNHPHIVHIYEIGMTPSDPASQGDLHFIAMEFIDGETLKAKIHYEKIDLRKSLELLAQVADALAKAHAAGIVHRDLKPDNIVVSSDGYAKIVDFGLAKLIEAPSRDEGGSDRTAVKDDTAEGVVLGTVGYMAPEQVQAKAIDHRADIFSFGCILYEAATRHKAFHSDSKIDTLHKIVHSQPPGMTTFNPDIPVDLQRIVRRCLAKDPEERYQSIKDVALELRELRDEISGISSGMHSLSSGAMAVPQGRKGRMLAIVGAASLVALIVAAMFYFRPRSEPAKPAGPSVQPNRMTRLTTDGNSPLAVISPDGKYLAHVQSEGAEESLWLTHIATGSKVQVYAPAAVTFTALTFSPDGNHLYYAPYDRGSALAILYEIPVLGGTAKQILEDVDSSPTFSPDGRRMAFMRGYPLQGETGLIVANVDGTGAKELFRGGKNILLDVNKPAWSPDGKTLVCTARRTTTEKESRANLLLIDAVSGKVATMLENRWLSLNSATWHSDGQSLFVVATEVENRTSPQIWKVPYPAGEPSKITNDFSSYSALSMTADGKVITAVQSQPNSTIWLAESGKEPVQITTGSGRNDGIGGLTFGPEGQVVYATDGDLWILDRRTGQRKQLTTGRANNGKPVVTPDGRYIVFASARSGRASLWRMDIDGRNVKMLTVDGGAFPDVTPDGKWVVYSMTDSPSGFGGTILLWKVPIEGGSPVKLTRHFARVPSVSPDGKWIACHYWDDPSLSTPWKLGIVPIEGGDATRKMEVPFRIAGTGAPPQIFGWTPDSRAVIYIDPRARPENLFAQPLDGGKPRQLTRFTSEGIFNYAESADGKQFLCARGARTFNVVQITDF